MINSKYKNCFLCGNQDFKRLFKAGNFWIGYCRTCGIVVTLDQDLRRVLRSRSNIYLDQSYLNFYLNPSFQKELIKRAEDRLLEIRELVNGRKILEVGCGRSPFLKVAKNSGWNVDGVEPCHEAVEYMRKGNKVIVYEGTLKTLETKEKFNVICYWDVLEHLPDPVGELKLAMKKLLPGGIIAIQVPNFGSVSSFLAKEHFDWLCPEDHLVHFTPATIQKVLIKSGFQIISLKTWAGGDSYLADFFNSLIPNWRWFGIFKYLLILLTKFTDRFFPWPGMLLSRIESIFLVNGLIIAYARKNEKE